MSVIRAERNSGIISELENYFFEIKESEEEKKKSKNNDTAYRIKRKMNEILRRDRTIPERDAMNMTADELWKAYNDYLELITYINLQTAYNPDKIEFCSYARISLNVYNILLQSNDDDIRQTVNDIDTDFINAAITSAETGISREGSTKFRAKAKVVGHSVKEVTPLDDLAQTAAESIVAKSIKAELENALLQANN